MYSKLPVIIKRAQSVPKLNIKSKSLTQMSLYMGRGTDRLFFSLLNKFCFKLICLHLDLDVIEGESLMWKNFARPAVLGFFFC